MNKLTSLVLGLLFMKYVTSFVPRQLHNDDMCKLTSSILCMKEELGIIRTVAQGVDREAKKIEESILQTRLLDTLKKNVEKEMNYTYPDLPIQQRHDEFDKYNNINKKFLIELLLEAHDAMVFFYNSIDDILELKVEYAELIDHSLQRIQINLRYEIICRYRSALHVYSPKWKPAHDISRMKFSKHHRLPPSMLHQVHTVVVLRYLQNWMEMINNITANLGIKYN